MNLKMTKAYCTVILFFLLPLTSNAAPTFRVVLTEGSPFTEDGKVIDIEVSDQRYQNVLNKYQYALSKTNFKDPTVKSVLVMYGRKYDTVKSEGELSLHIDDPIPLWIELLSNQPKKEIAILRFLFNKQLPTIATIIPESLPRFIQEKCLDNGQTELPKEIYSHNSYEESEDDAFVNQLNYFYTSEDRTVKWDLNLRKDSCIVSNFSFSKKNKKGKLIEKVEIREDLTAKRIIDNPRIVNFKADTKYRGTKTPIGVIDSGIDYNNRSIQKKLLPNLSPSKVLFLGLDMVDPGTLPFDFYADDFTFSMRSIDYRIQHQHGTHVAGIATKNTEELAIIPMRLIGGDGTYDLSVNSDEIYEKINSSILYLKKHGVKCVNMSFGVTDEDESSKEYKKALEKVISENTDMVFVAAAGNDSDNLDEKPQYPANFLLKNVITVASIDESGELSNFSNYNNTIVNIAARGSNILSQWPYGPPIELSGTSMAAPQVTRVCGRIQHKKPKWSAIQIVEHILKTAKIDAQLTEFVSMGRVLNEDQAIKDLD